MNLLDMIRFWIFLAISMAVASFTFVTILVVIDAVFIDIVQKEVEHEKP